MLLAYLARDPQRVYTKDELLREVWGYHSTGTTRTVDSHACRLRRALANAGANDWVRSSWGVGYCLAPRSPLPPTGGSHQSDKHAAKLVRFGARFRQVREHQRLNVSELAAGTGIEIQRIREVEAGRLVANFDAKSYDALLSALTKLRTDYEVFRSGLFAAAGLPAEPEETWATFIASGEAYRQHLVESGDHDESRCLYCRQTLEPAAVALVSKYREFLEDKIASDTVKAEAELTRLTEPPSTFATSDIVSFLDESAGVESPSVDVVLVRRAASLLDELRQSMSNGSALRDGLLNEAADCLGSLRDRHKGVAATVATQVEQVANRTEALGRERKKLTELTAAIELSRSWTQVESQVSAAKESDRLGILGKIFPTLQRKVTDLSKAASDRMINQSFDALFAEECDALRAPVLKVQYVGRQGKAQRRKVLRGKHKPSKVLSEGEQKVLAIADFLAEARLTGITATVVFDDPVSSLTIAGSMRWQSA
jgi:transcriptional regulator with XRE-family HTH domain